MSMHAPWEKTFDKVVTPFEEFIHHESTSGLLLMACAIMALILANSTLHTTYEHILHAQIVGLVNTSSDTLGWTGAG